MKKTKRTWSIKKAPTTRPSSLPQNLAPRKPSLYLIPKETNYILKSMRNGFTMFELMITISIMVIIAALVLVNFPGFNRQVAVNRAAQEISLALRSAQARALAVQKF